jgi:hypothetical protein
MPAKMPMMVKLNFDIGPIRVHHHMQGSPVENNSFYTYRIRLGRHFFGKRRGDWMMRGLWHNKELENCAFILRVGRLNGKRHGVLSLNLFKL